MKNKKKNNIIIIIFILMLGIGFAALSTELNIRNLVGFNESRWSIYFDNVEVTKGQDLAITNPTTVSNTTKSLSYEINLNEPGDIYSFDVDIVNDSTMDAMVTLVDNSSLSNDLQKVIDYKVTYKDGPSIQRNTLLIKNSREKITVSVNYKEDINPEDLNIIEEQILSFNIEIEYMQADEKAFIRTKHFEIVNMNEDYLKFGDELAIGDEHFYIINQDEDAYYLLAKYNLYVGQNCTATGNFNSNYNYIIYSSCELIDEGDPKYGKQNEIAKGYYGSPVAGEVVYGIVQNAQSHYWYDNINIKIKDEYTYTYYDLNYSGKPNFYLNGNLYYQNNNQYGLAYYGEEYKNYLTTEYSVIIDEVDLLSRNVVKDTDVFAYSAIPRYEWSSNTSYWLGNSILSAEKKRTYTKYIGKIRTDSDINHGWSRDSMFFGFRPVIKVLKENL